MTTTIQKAIRRGLAPFKPAPPVRLSEWASEHFYLSAESSYVEGGWRSYPYQVAILDAMSHRDIREVVVSKSARVGFTKCLLAAIGYFAQHRRWNQGIWQPTDDDAGEFCKTELEPMLRDVAIMQTVFPGNRAKDKANTLRSKQFIGCNLFIRGGKAARNFRRLSIDVAIVDELDGFDLDIEHEGSPVLLASKRVEGATWPKVIFGSTPKLKHLSMIEARYAAAELQFRFNIPCPHCAVEHPLRWGDKGQPFGMKWVSRDVETIQQLCPSCGSLYGQADYLRTWDQGRWVAQDGTWIDPGGRFIAPYDEARPAPTSIGFHIWTAYSPHTAWSQILREYFAAVDKARAGDKSEIKAFKNTALGESYEDEIEKANEHELQQRAEDYRLRTVPLGCLVLTAGVDVQDTRFEVVVWGFGRGEEMWVVDHMVIEGNPADERDWEKLDAYLQTRFPHASGLVLKIEITAIDTGGHFTHQTYAFCRQRARRRIFAIKGDHQQGKPIKGKSSMQDVNWRGSVVKNGVRLWMVGTDTAKDLFYGRLQVRQPGPGYVHFSKELSEEFYKQLTGEARVLQRTARGTVHMWVKRRPRNEALDCTVYALFGSHALDLHRYTGRMWDRLESAVQPPTRDMFDASAPAEPPKDPVPMQEPAQAEQLPASLPLHQPPLRPQRRPRRSGFSVSRW